LQHVKSSFTLLYFFFKLLRSCFCCSLNSFFFEGSAGFAATCVAGPVSAPHPPKSHEKTDVDEEGCCAADAGAVAVVAAGTAAAVVGGGAGNAGC